MALESLFVIFTTIATISTIYGMTINEDFKNTNNVSESTTNTSTDTVLTPPELIQQHGYPAQVHTVQTSDGYLLQLHRIPYGKKGPGNKKRIPVLLYHGYTCSSFHWLIVGPERSLGYRLADEGYDVWMINSRGNTYSTGHINYTTENSEYWDFSFHEMGIYDLPATIDYILEVTNQKQLVYIGHSLGATIFYVMASSLPEYNNKVILQIGLASFADLPNSTSAYKTWLPIANWMMMTRGLIKWGSFMTHDSSHSIFQMFCTENKTDFHTCEEMVIGPIFGKDSDQFDLDILSIIWKYTPAGTSGKTFVHCSQLFSKNSFRQFDYEEEENLEIYKTPVPPSYDLKRITTPTRLYYADNDILADPTDTKLLYQQFPNPRGLVRIPHDKFNHADFIWAKDLNKLLNDELIQYINNATDNAIENATDPTERAKSSAAPLGVRLTTLGWLYIFTYKLVRS